MTRQARIAALLGGELDVREVYRIRRGFLFPAELPKPGGKLLSIGRGNCWRCGAICSPHGVGVRAVLTVLTRERGTVARGIQARHLHVGCVPTELDAPLGIPARKVRR